MAPRAQNDTGGELAVALPRARARAVTVGAERPRWWLDVLVIAWLAWVYDIVANLAPLRQHAAINHARGLLDLERALYLDPERALNRWLVSHHTLATVLS